MVHAELLLLTSKKHRRSQVFPLHGFYEEAAVYQHYCHHADFSTSFYRGYEFAFPFSPRSSRFNVSSQFSCPKHAYSVSVGDAALDHSFSRVLAEAYVF